ncbi:MAG: ArsJ-associated glyceraldehyde-3-phosphate dehydrogenase [Pseudomonadota bacterium]
MARVALNGLGRIGKLLLRRLVDTGFPHDIVWANDPGAGVEDHAVLLEFDSVHGRWDKPVTVNGNALDVAGRTIPIRRETALEAFDMSGVDLVLDSTGVFRTGERIEPYFDAGASKVLVSAPVKDGGALNLVYGINHDLYDPAVHRIVTAASCTTNCLAPVVKVIHEEIGIRHGSITTIHDITNTQTIVDRPAKNLRRARSAMTNLIPTTTGSATAITLIYPELKGRLNGHAVRVPLLNASITDCVFEVERETNAAEVNALFQKWADGPLEGILGVETRELVSSDYLNEPRSAVIDAQSTMVVNGTQVKIYAWYDNEWGYACRMADLALMMAGKM